MITPYTSFIAVTETIRNESGESTDVKPAIPLPRQVSDLAIGGYTVGSEPGFMLLLAFAAAAAGDKRLFPEQEKKDGRKG